MITLQTERLTLGPASLTHVEAFVGICTTDRSRFNGGPAPRREAWQGVAFQAGLWTLRGYGAFWPTETATGAPAGRVGIEHPDWLDEPELGWLVYAPVEGRGFAYEAAVAARDWARSIGLALLRSLIAPGNTRSLRPAQRLDALPDGEHRYDDGTIALRLRHTAGGPA